jgi:hypothetical protein
MVMMRVMDAREKETENMYAAAMGGRSIGRWRMAGERRVVVGGSSRVCRSKQQQQQQQHSQVEREGKCMGEGEKKELEGIYYALR